MVLHDTCYIAHQFQDQRSRSQAHIVCTSHLCLFFIRETNYCRPTCVTKGGRGHTASANPADTLLVKHSYIELRVITPTERLMIDRRLVDNNTAINR